MSSDYKVVNISCYLKTQDRNEAPIFGDRIALPKDCPEWLEDLACYGTAYTKGNLNNRDHYIFKTTYNESEKKWYGKYLGFEPAGCNCG